MSTSTMTSRKSWGTLDSAEHDGILRETVDDPLLGRRPTRLLELVVEEVVALLHGPRVGRALVATASVDVEVGEDAHEPGSEVRARRVRAPAPEGPRVRLLDEVLGLLARGHETTRYAVNLVGQLENLLFETSAIAGLLGDPTGVCLGLGHRARTVTVQRLRKPALFLRNRPETGPAHRSEEVVPRHALVVPGEGDPAEQVRVRRLEARHPLERRS